MSSAFSTVLSPSRTEVSAWPVSSCSSRASRRRSISCPSMTRRSESRWTRRERSTATAARCAKCSASRRSALVKRGSRPSLIVRERDPDRAVPDQQRDVEPGRSRRSGARPPGRPRDRRAPRRPARCDRARALPDLDLVGDHSVQQFVRLPRQRSPRSAEPSAVGKRDRNDPRVDQLAQPLDDELQEASAARARRRAPR